MASPIVCPRCQRPNPSQAMYCYFDGNLLRMDAAAATAPGQLQQDYVFPSKRRCRTLDDFVQGCQYEWEEARDLLKRGEFARYFTTVGRRDLAKAAKEAEGGGDADAALHTFLGALPATQILGPKLDFKPRRLVLKNVKPGEVHILPLKLINQGKGLLQGRVRVSEGSHWLRLDSDDGQQLAIKVSREEDIILHVDTRGLAAPECYTARLTIISNGGISEIPIRLDLGVTPFAVAGPFKGAARPRDLAERMRANPKAAVPLLENGEIANWFAVNGWTFPIFGLQARGVAAVQQFFEGLGLSKPPPLRLSENEVHCLSVPPELIQRQITLFTPAKKWVYGQIDSDAIWLKVTTPNIAGPQQAGIGFEIDTSLMEEGQIHTGHLTISANAGQRLTVRVVVDVQKPYQPLTRRLFGRLFQIGLITMAYRLLLFLPGDVFARMLATSLSVPPAGTLARWSIPAAQEDGYLRLLVLATWWIGALVGLALLWQRRARWTDLITGAVAGAMLGGAAAVTVGCVATFLDLGPRLLAGRMASSSSAAAGTSVWLLLVLLWWTGLGAGAGSLLQMAGKRGRETLAAFSFPLLWVLEGLGLPRFAAMLGATLPPTPRVLSAQAPVAGFAPPVVAIGGVTRKG